LEITVAEELEKEAEAKLAEDVDTPIKLIHVSVRHFQGDKPVTAREAISNVDGDCESFRLVLIHVLQHLPAHRGPQLLLQAI
jgi:hypothetical protein